MHFTKRSGTGTKEVLAMLKYRGSLVDVILGVLRFFSELRQHFPHMFFFFSIRM